MMVSVEEKVPVESKMQLTIIDPTVQGSRDGIKELVEELEENWMSPTWTSTIGKVSG